MTKLSQTMSKAAVLARMLCMATAWASTAVTSHAGVVQDPALVPVGQSAAYQSRGVFSDGMSQRQWNYNDSGSAVNLFTAVAGSNPDSFANLDHSASVAYGAGGLTLHSASRFDVTLAGGNAVNAVGWSNAITNDLITLQAASTLVGASILTFNWKVDGHVSASLTSTGPQNLNSINGFYYGGYTAAEIFMSWSAPGQSGANSSNLPGSSSAGLWREMPNAAQRDFQEYLTAANAYNNYIFAPNIKEWSDVHDANNNQSTSDLLTLPVGSTVAILFGLATGYNIHFNPLDFGGLVATLDSDFGHTALLESVDLFNADGTPYIGPWSLESAAGIDYPEHVVLVAGSVPEPANGVLMLIGLIGLGVYRARRRFSRA